MIEPTQIIEPIGLLIMIALLGIGLFIMLFIKAAVLKIARSWLGQPKLSYSQSLWTVMGGVMLTLAVSTIVDRTYVTELTTGVALLIYFVIIALLVDILAVRILLLASWRGSVSLASIAFSLTHLFIFLLTWWLLDPDFWII